jgi:hypothetical protein
MALNAITMLCPADDVSTIAAWTPRESILVVSQAAFSDRRG